MDCPQKAATVVQQRLKTHKVNLISSKGDDSYRKVARGQNGEFIMVYLDTGSEYNIVTQQCIERLSGCKVRPTIAILRGFGGGLVPGTAEATFCVNVEGVELQIDAVVVDHDLSGVDLIIGQPALQGNVVLQVREGRVSLSRPEDLIQAIQLDEGDLTDEERRYPVRMVSDMTIHPGSQSMVPVQVDGPAKMGELVVLALRHEECGTWVAIPTTVIGQGEDRTLEVSNLGNRPVTWKAGHVVARASLCDTRQPGRVERVIAGKAGEAKLDFSTIEVGDMSMEDKAQLVALLERMANCFSASDTDLGLTHLGEMRIHLMSDRPVHYRPYRLAQVERAKVREKIQSLLASGVIRESESEYASPIILIPKKNGDVRMCVDYRALNRSTVKDRYPMPLVSDQLDRLAGKCYFTTLDLAQGYHQVPMHPDSVPKTAFVTPDGHYEYLRVPFGLANAPAVFQRVINKMLGDLQNGAVLAYMDDLLIPSATISEGMVLLERVLNLVAEAGLKLNLSKCSFLKGQLEYLGHEVSAAGVQPGTRKVRAVSDFPAPENVHGVRQFVGLVSYFRKFIRNFAVLARPLTDLLKKDVPWRWCSEQRDAFSRLKQLLVERPILALYDGEVPTEVHTDACKLEILALVDMVRRFRVYLVGVHFKTVTDCSTVRATLLKRDLVPRIARWWMALQEYDMELEYRPGTKMQHVDALSRNPVEVRLDPGLKADYKVEWATLLA